MRSTVATHRDIRWSAAPFFLFHFVPLLAVFTGVTWKAVFLGAALYAVRMVAITAGYHRYFAHRTYKMSRVMHTIVGFIGTSAAQQGPLWWASHHRNHHKYADTERDPHSPQKGFFWSHVGWVLSGDFGRPDLSNVQDLAKYPELRFLNSHDWIGPWSLAIGSFLYAGWSGLVIGFFASTIMTWHCTFSINSFSHVFGRRRYATPDTSRNSLILALITFGEGWHNNHHHFPRSVRQGFRWYEVDISYYVIRAAGLFRLTSDFQMPTAAARSARLIKSGHFDVGIFRDRLATARKALPHDAIQLRQLLQNLESEAAAFTSGKRVGKRAVEPA